MFKTALVLTIGLLTQLTSASKCSIKLTAYSDNTCTTTKDYPPLFPNGQVNYEMNFGKCYTQQAGGLTAHMKMLYCDPDTFVAMNMYNDGGCSSKASPAVRGFEAGVCQIIASDTWITVTDISLTGNKYGIGWQEGWAIFLCQTVLFGVCQGY